MPNYSTSFGFPVMSNKPGRTSLIDKCHQNICTLGLLMRTVLIKLHVCLFLRPVRNYHGTDDIKKYRLEGVPKKSKFPVKNWL